LIFERHTRLALSTIFRRVEEIGVPYRTRVKGLSDFMSKAVHHHNKSPVFANVFENRDGVIKLNKLFFDFDHADQRVVEKDLNYTRDKLIERGIPKDDIYKIWTTKKGDHLYAEMKPVFLRTKEEKIEWRRKMRGFQYTITKGCESVDTAVFGDFSRVARVVGIQRPDNNKIPVVVDLETPLNTWLRKHRSWGERMDAGDNILESWGTGYSNFDDIITPEDYENVYFSNYTDLPTDISNYSVNAITDTFGGQYKDALLPLFKSCMSEELVARIFDTYCDNQTRVAGARHLLETGLGVDVVCNLLALCGWNNFNYGFTYRKLQDLTNWK